MASLAIMVNSESINKTHLLCLQVTVEQEVAIYAFFQFNSWKIIREVIPDKCAVCNTKISRTDEIDQSQLDALFGGQLAANTESQSESPVVIQILDHQSPVLNIAELEQQPATANIAEFEQQAPTANIAKLEQLPSVTNITEFDQQGTSTKNVNVSDVQINSDKSSELFTSVIKVEKIYQNTAGQNLVNCFNENTVHVENTASKCVLNQLDGNNVNLNCSYGENVNENMSDVDDGGTEISFHDEDEILPKDDTHGVYVTSVMHEKDNINNSSEAAGTEKNLSNDLKKGLENIEEKGYQDENIVEKMASKQFCEKKPTLNFDRISQDVKKDCDKSSTRQSNKRQILRQKKETEDGDILTKDVYPFYCTRCNKGFMENKYLQKHMNSYHSDKSRICDKCGKSFRHLSFLRRHEREHDEDVIKYKCDECDKIFIDEDKLEKHKKCHLDLKPYTCEVCGRCFRQVGHLNCHRETHKDNKSRKFKCDHCDLTFADATSRLRHNRTHTGAKPYPCKDCGKNFRQFSHLQEHLRIHTGERPYKCDICNKTFSDRSSHRKHRDMHLGVKHKCPECGKQFAQTCSLRRHLNTHTKDKIYDCDDCGRTFLYLTALQKHKEKHLKGWKCKHCTSVFNSKDEHTLHQKTHIKQNRYKCEICLSEFKTSTVLKRHYRVHENFQISEGTTTVLRTINLPVIIMADSADSIVDPDL